MKRRDFIKAIACSAAAWPLAARAQKPAMPVVGYLGFGSPKGFATRLAAFRQGLQETGYREGQSVAIEYRWAEEQNDRLPELAIELGNARLERSRFLGAHPTAAGTSIIAWVRHAHCILAGVGPTPPEPSNAAAP